MNLSDASKIEYDYETKTGSVWFTEGHPVVFDEVVAYFEEATDGRVMLIRIFHGDKLTEELRFNVQN